MLFALSGHEVDVRAYVQLHLLYDLVIALAHIDLEHICVEIRYWHQLGLSSPFYLPDAVILNHEHCPSVLIQLIHHSVDPTSVVHPEHSREYIRILSKWEGVDPYFTEIETVFIGNHLTYKRFYKPES